jgi:hypothetical protein
MKIRYISNRRLVMKWVAFIGEGRSGHTIVSAIIGGYDYARIGEEQKYIGRWWRKLITPEQVIPHLCNTGYGRQRKHYAPWAPVDRHKEPLQLVGDKCGWDAVMEVKKREAPVDLIHKFGEAMGMPIKLIHTTRDPRQNIAAWYHSPKYIRLWGEHAGTRMRYSVRRYARFYTTAQAILDVHPDVYHLRHEELILNPANTLNELFEYLEVPLSKQYRRWVQKHLFKTLPLRETPWSQEWDDAIQERILSGRFPSLDYYNE